jgi:glyoxylase-like metal-dependent hydrolase (beta-lactamase superfamily II)
MKAEVKVLIEGYLMHESDGGIGCTVTLIKDNGKNIIVDPGTTKTPNEIEEKLKAEGLKLEDIDMVFLTHSHYDHFKNVGIFPNARIIEYWGAWDGDKISSRKQKFFSDDIELLKTPGHSLDSLSLIVKTDQGKIAVVGDLWWQENFPEYDKVAQDNEVLKIERQRILELADHIIPGHGNIFKTKNN